MVVFAVFLFAPDTAKDGPVPIVWDREVCAHCRMHIGVPGFAAQLQTRGGEVLDFDDPGCLFDYLERNRPAIAHLYFHHHSADRWLDERHAYFVHQSPSPMGYGLAAADASEAGSIDLNAARAAVRNGHVQAETGGHP
jgi:copper chaperone NosL